MSIPVRWSAVASVGLALAACGPSAIKYEDHTRTIITKAAVPVPQPPVASGPMPEPQHMVLEARLSGAGNVPSAYRSGSSSPAHLVPNLHLTGRMTYGLAPWAEFGAALGFSPATPNTALIEGLTEDHLGSGNTVDAAAVLRFMWAMDDTLGVGFDLEAGAQSLPTYRVILDEVTISYRATDGYDTWMETTSDETSDAYTARRGYGLLRMGPVLGLRLDHGLYLGFGASLQAQPYVRAVYVQSWGCTWYEGEDTNTPCEAAEPSLGFAEAVILPYLDLTVPAGKRLVQLRLFASTPSLGGNLPAALGADLAIRRDFLAR